MTSMSQDDGSLMEAIANSDELEIYQTQLVKDVIDYKWITFAKNQQLLGALIHTCYVLCLIFYINDVFLRKNTYDEDGNRLNPPPNENLLLAQMACLLYPLFYDGTQMWKKGLSYLEDTWNYVDVLNISMGYFTVYSQMYIGTWELSSKISMILVILVCMTKTFFYMRIVESFSYIVTMIIRVMGDLKVFLLFFIILIVMCSMIFDVIAINNADEYKYIGPYWGNMMSTLRLSLGDFDFGVLTDTDNELN